MWFHSVRDARAYWFKEQVNLLCRYTWNSGPECCSTLAWVILAWRHSWYWVDQVEQQKMSIIKDVCSMNVFLQLAATQHYKEGKHKKKKKKRVVRKNIQIKTAQQDMKYF